MKFNKIITSSKAIARFAEVGRLSENDVFELYFECYCSYIDMFRERMKYARNLRRIISIYKPIKAFGMKSPEQIIDAMFCSPHMHEWFAYRFLEAIDMQLMNKKTNKRELQLGLTFMRPIPTKESMEEILNGDKIQHKQGMVQQTKSTAHAAGNKTGRTGNKTGVRV